MKNKHSFGFTPKYSKTLKPTIKPRVYVELAKEAYQKFDWELIYESGSELHGLRHDQFSRVTEKISVIISQNETIQIQSKSENKIWDMGRNSRIVHSIITEVENSLNSLTKDQISEIDKKVTAKDNWDDYIVPETLPTPPRYKQPNILVPIIGYFLLSFGLGYLISNLFLSGVYVIGLFEVIIGFILAYSLKLFMPLSNYTDSKNLIKILFVSVFLIYFLNQYFQFLHFKKEYPDLTFITFILERLKHGLVLKGLDTGTIGQIVFWIIQIGLTYLVAYFQCFKLIMDYSIKKVPDEVINFSIYNLFKNKTEKELKTELRKRGWKNDLEHNMIFNALSYIYAGQQHNRTI